jgi:SNF2 family DNA or RNA helicase
VAVDYGTTRGIRFHLPSKSDPVIQEICGDIEGRVLTDARQVLSGIEALKQAGRRVQIYPDAEAFVQQQLVQERVKKECEKIRQSPSTHKWRNELLKATLLPYQLDGIAFIAGAGRAILADDMGLGKTIQGIGVAELLARLEDIRRVLIVCPTSLKSQWRTEIERFSGRSSQLILGSGAERAEQYHGT